MGCTANKNALNKSSLKIAVVAFNAKSFIHFAMFQKSNTSYETKTKESPVDKKMKKPETKQEVIP